MKGKYAKRATQTRDWAALQSRAEHAEHESARLEAELSEHQAVSSRTIATLRAQLAEAKRQRDAAEGPAVAALEEQNRQLRDEKRELEASYKARDEQFWFALRRTVIAIKAAFNVPETEARELVVNAMGVSDEISATSVDEYTRGIKDPVLVKILQRARGMRSMDDPMSRAAEALGIDDLREKVL